MLDGIFNMAFGALISWSKLGGLLAICFLLTLITTLIYKFMTNQSVMKALREDIKGIQKEIKELKGDPSKMMEAQKRAMEKNMKYMMQSFKPMIITFIPIVIIFGWLKSKFENEALLFGLSWIWVYIISSIIFSTILRKILKVH